MEFVWAPFQKELGKTGEIFTHVLYKHYSSPPGFNVDELHYDDPIVTNPKYTNYNLDRKLEDLHAFYTEQAKAYKTDHLLSTFGDDFEYGNALMNYRNIDKLIPMFN